MKRLLSGITPSGDGSLHIGNYLGAVRQFIKLAQDHECFLMFADLHALTTIQDRQVLEKNIETLILNEIALIGDLPHVHFFRQSDVPLHAELQTILNNVTPLGLLKRAHAYKDKLQTEVSEEEINLGLFNYPVLMAADILLYKPAVVPVGKDQKQHIEITRDIAERFNKTFKNQVFPLPQAYIPPEVAVVLGTDGKRKMSKSLGNIISIFENEETIKKQVMSTYTDPTRGHATDPGHIEGNMVFAYLDYFGDTEVPRLRSGQVISQLKEKYTKGEVGDVEVKEFLFKTLIEYFTPARKRYEALRNDPQKVKAILEKGTAEARRIAAQTMTQVRQVIGLTNSYSFFKYQFAAGSIISIDDFNAVKLQVGKVIAATDVEKSEKLIRLTVDFKETQHVIFTAVRQFGYTAEFFKNKQFIFITNLEPRKMLSEYSEGMILAIDGPDKPIFLQVDELPLGSYVH